MEPHSLINSNKDTTDTTFIEPILDTKNKRFTTFPIQYNDIWELYKHAVACFWTVEEIDLGKDKLDWEKLTNNEIAGAILDVFTHEPLEASSKLWNTPNLVLTPHVSSDDDGNYVELTLDIFFNNLKLFIENKELSNQVDKKLGY